MKLVPWLLLPLLGGLAVWSFVPREVVTYRDVIVPVERIIEREPDTVRTFVDRVVTVEVSPRQVATAQGGGSAQVASFCRPTVLTVTQTDTVEVPAPELLLRSVSHRPGWYWQRDELLLTGPTSHGDLRALDYEVRPGFTARTVADSVLVQYPRSSLLKEIAEPFIAAAVGYGIAQVF